VGKGCAIVGGDFVDIEEYRARNVLRVINLALIFVLGGMYQLASTTRTSGASR
jgi:hypothetical protein